jgi:hypothetical protein
MRRLGLLPLLVLLVGCASPASPSQMPVSCQPIDSSPRPIAFSFAPGNVTSSVAEQTAAALFRACQNPGSVTDLTSSSKATTGVKLGPNAGQAVWLVQVDATVAGAASVRVAYLIEVNQATGVPTIIGMPCNGTEGACG